MNALQQSLVLAAAAMMVVGHLEPASAQTPAPAPATLAPEEENLTEKKEDTKEKTLWDEFKLFSFGER